MTVPMTARRSFPYAGKRLKAGDEFNARGEQDAKILSAIGHAQRREVVAEAGPLASHKYATRAMTAGPAGGYGYATKIVATIAATVEAASSVAKTFVTFEGESFVLDDMEAEALHALADRMGVKVHHLAGAKKVREAIIKAQGK